MTVNFSERWSVIRLQKMKMIIYRALITYLTLILIRILMAIPVIIRTLTTIRTLMAVRKVFSSLIMGRMLKARLMTIHLISHLTSKRHLPS